MVATRGLRWEFDGAGYRSGDRAGPSFCCFRVSLLLLLFSLAPMPSAPHLLVGVEADARQQRLLRQGRRAEQLRVDRAVH